MLPAAEKNFYIFRHGECPLNVSGHIQGRSIDGSLTENGRRQAEEVGKKLQNRGIEVIITSPMKRARQTAQIANRYLGVPICVDHRFTEVDMGEAEGLHLSEIEKNYAGLYHRWRHCTLEDTTTRFKGGETKAEVRRRVFEALEYYAAETAYRCVAVSGHGIVIAQIMLQFGQRSEGIPNGSILRLHRQAENWDYRGFLE